MAIAQFGVSLRRRTGRSSALAAIVLAVVASGLLGPALAHASDPMPPTLIVLDGSNSMWGKVPGGTKIKSAQTALARLAARLPDAMALGLMSYGHRRKASCEDIALEAPVAAGQEARARFATALDRLTPRGKTPIAAALTAAGAALPKDAPARLLVIVDGQDNCRGDPCKVAADLKASHPRLVIHGVGFSEEPERLESLQCLTSPSGGTFALAKDRAGLEAALESVLGTGPMAPQTAQPRSADETARTAAETEPPTGRPIHFRARLGPDSPALGNTLQWRVWGQEARAGQGAPQLSEPIIRNEADPVLTLTAGRYLVEAAIGEARTRTEVVLTPDQAPEVWITLNAGVMRVAATGLPEGRAGERALISIRPAGAEGAAAGPPIAYAMSADSSVFLPAGAYRVTARYGQFEAATDVTLAPGDYREAQVPMAFGTLQLTTATTEGGPPLERVVYYVSRIDPTTGRATEVHRSAASRPSWPLPAGQYRVRAEHDLVSVETDIAVETGAVTRKRLNLNAATLKLTSNLKDGAALGSADVQHQILPADARGEPSGPAIARTTRQDRIFTLPPGAYVVESRIGSVNSTVRQRVRLKPGELAEAVLAHSIGRLRLSIAAKDPTTQSAQASVFWRVRGSDGTEVWRSNRAMPEVLLASGRYEIVAEVGEATLKAAVALAEGEDRAVVLAVQSPAER